MGFVFVPQYIKFIGTEAYGLIGLFAVLTSILALFDFGLGSAGARELARNSGNTDIGSAIALAEMVRTLEWILWGLSLLFGVLIFLVSPYIVRYWLNVGALGSDVAIRALELMAIGLAASWPSNFYSNCLQGLHKQVSANTLTVVLATTRGVGALLVLALYSSTVEAFFIWNAIMACISTIAMRRLVWLSYGGVPRRFSAARLRSIRQFAVGMTGISVLSLVLRNADKAILSKLLSLEQFGYYTLAAMVANFLSMILGPLVSALYPRYTQIVATGNGQALSSLFRTSSQLIAVVVVPLGLTLSMFSYEILLAWTGNRTIVQAAYLVLSILALGTTFNSLLNAPYYVLLAHGRTGIAVRLNVVCVTAFVPLVYTMTNAYGLVGAAAAWLILNSAYLLITPTLIARAVLPGELGYWYVKSALFPVVAALTPLVLVRFCLSWGAGQSSVTNVVVIVCAYCLAVVFAACAAPDLRTVLLRRLRLHVSPRAAK